MKKILSRDAVRRIDQATINGGVASVDLMERAALAFTSAFKKLHRGGPVTVVCGPGNNGGDGLAVARLLHEAGTRVNVFYLDVPSLSDDFKINLKRFDDIGLRAEKITTLNGLPDIEEGTMIDALFGTGLTRPLTDPALSLVKWMNAQPVSRVSIDVPSGTLEIPSTDRTVVLEADHVISFQVPRVELLLPRHDYNPLTLQLVDIGLDENAIEQETTDFFLVEERDIRKRLKHRRLFDHKYSYGHALIAAGSRRTLGAALLATGAALRSGCGLVTTHTVKGGNTALNTLFPDAMFSSDAHDEYITNIALDARYNAIGMGSGMGRDAVTAGAVVDVLTKSNLCCVIDADALNTLSEHHGWEKTIPAGCILTPHHKEFDRMAGEQPNDHTRMQNQIALARQLRSVIIVKGAFTRIATPEGKCFFNSTGTPALATAGSGDVLTGLLTGLVARGYNAVDAALVGVYVHGMAGRLAAERYGMDALKAHDITEHLPEAFKLLYE